MRLAVSNIAWPIEADAQVAKALKTYGVEGVELAPTKYWPSPLEASEESLRTCRHWWEDRGLDIIAMQALLYGRNDLTIFGDPKTRLQTRDYLCRIIDLANHLGAKALVFGSPKNRLRGELSPAKAVDVAGMFFRDLGRHASAQGIELCLEANPTEYGCDFIVNSPEAIRFVEQVGQDGFGLHLDTGGMALATDPAELTIQQAKASGRWRHFHISEPYLAPIGTVGTEHVQLFKALQASRYSEWLSIEMKQSDEGNGWYDNLCRSLQFVRATYDGDLKAQKVA